MNATDTQDLKTMLAQSDAGFRALFEQHHHLDDRLHELGGKHHLSDSEQREEMVLKKRKLALKDQMEQLAREYAHRQTAS